LLRNAFPKFDADKSTPNSIKLNKARVIWWMLTGDETIFDINRPLDRKSVEMIYVHQLEEEIFEGVRYAKRMNIYKSDIFYEAVIVKGNKKGKLLGSDFITPHKHKTKPELDALTNPTPLMFLKVLPAVTFEFRFKLHDSEIDNVVKNTRLAAKEKEKLFEEILRASGIGAKTNVGYGQFKTTV
jgi:CRISPR type III-B/RAMP module RAMP protein Cmr6